MLYEKGADSGRLARQGDCRLFAKTLMTALQVFLLLSFANGMPGPEDTPLERGFSLAVAGNQHADLPVHSAEFCDSSKKCTE